MLQRVEPISLSDFDKGLNTKSNFLQNEKGQSPNCMNIKWNFDGSIQKRSGSTTQNTIAIGSSSPSGWTVNNALSNSLQAFWKLNEPSGTRSDEFGTNNLTPSTIDPTTTTGIRGLAPIMVMADTSLFYINNTATLTTLGSFSMSIWFYLNQTAGAVTDSEGTLIAKRNPNEFEYWLYLGTNNQVVFEVSSAGTPSTADVTSIIASSAGALSITGWYNVVAWHDSGANGHIGVSVNLSANSSAYTGGVRSGSSQFILGARRTDSTVSIINARIDEVGFWKRTITAAERADLYGGGTGNTFTKGQSGFGWAMYDFGASSIRWLTVAAGTGIYASSNLGVTFVEVHTNRTQNYQYFQRSKNVLIATSDSYDVPLFWAGSVGTFFQTLAPNSAPKAKLSINQQGFLILLNYQDSNGTIKKRGFAYADDNSQLTSTWTNFFELPSTADDEITAAFILNRTLYVSTKYTIFRVSYIGGNPDWSYQPVKDWGYVPRTVKKCSVEGEEVAVGLDWARRLRMFDGSKDLIISSNVESDNQMCDFATSKISFAGSGLIVSNAEVDSLEQEYRLNVAIGDNSSQTTHAILLNLRTLALYPYDNQMYQAMVSAESAGRLFLTAVDRSGRIHILNTGNLDISTRVNDIYHSPFFYKVVPGVVRKEHKVDLYFEKESSGTIFYQDRADLSSNFSVPKRIDIIKSESITSIVKSIDIPSTHEILQFSLSSSSNTANPWKLTHGEMFGQSLGIGKGN